MVTAHVGDHHHENAGISAACPDLVSFRRLLDRSTSVAQTSTLENVERLETASLQPPAAMDQLPVGVPLVRHERVVAQYVDGEAVLGEPARDESVCRKSSIYSDSPSF